MSKITLAQNKHIFGLLRKAEETAYRDDYAFEASNERVSNVADLSTDEAFAMISLLNDVLSGLCKPMNPNSALAFNFDALPHKIASIVPMMERAGNPETNSEKAQRLRRTIMRYCHDMGWYKFTPGTQVLELNNGKPILDYKRIDNYCKTHSALKKALNEHTAAELVKLVYQFKTMATNTVFKKAK